LEFALSGRGPLSRNNFGGRANLRGPRVVPGMYQVRLMGDGKTLSENFEVKPDPRLTATSGDYAKQLELGFEIRDKVTETHTRLSRLGMFASRLTIC